MRSGPTASVDTVILQQAHAMPMVENLGAALESQIRRKAGVCAYRDNLVDFILQGGTSEADRDPASLLRVEICSVAGVDLTCGRVAAENPSAASPAPVGADRLRGNCAI